MHLQHHRATIMHASGIDHGKLHVHMIMVMQHVADNTYNYGTFLHMIMVSMYQICNFEWP